MQNALLLSLLLSSLLSGCASFGNLFDKVNPVEVVSKPIEKTPLNIPPPEPLQLKSVKWVIITKDNAQQVFDELEKAGEDVVLFGLTDTGYQQLSISFAEIRNFISTQREIIAQYKEYYEPKPPEQPKEQK